MHRPKKLDLLHPHSLIHLHTKLHNLVNGRLWLKVLIGMFLGIVVGLILGPTADIVDQGLASAISEWLALPGSIFIRIIQMIVIPLIFASIINGIAASENLKQLKKVGVIITLFFLITTIISIGLGIGLASWINPGQYVSKEILETAVSEPTVADNGLSAPSLGNLPTLFSSLLPTNIFGSVLNGEMLQIVIFSVIFGIALVHMKKKQSKPLLELLAALQNVCMTIVKWAMLLAPIAVFGLMAKLTSQFGLDTLLGIGAYVLTVLLGLFVILILYSVIAYLILKVSPWSYYGRMRDVLLLAFSTSSSAAVMPLSIKTAEEKFQVRPSVSQFVIPIGATVDMNGTALYQAVAVVFLAQIFGVNLGLTSLLLLIVSIVGASIGSPATPGVGIAILALIIDSIGIPLSGIALILGVDRILDMSRTVVNVSGDITASIFVNKTVAEDLPAEK